MIFTFLSLFLVSLSTSTSTIKIDNSLRRRCEMIKRKCHWIDASSERDRIVQREYWPKLCKYSSFRASRVLVDFPDRRQLLLILSFSHFAFAAISTSGFTWSESIGRQNEILFQILFKSTAHREQNHLLFNYSSSNNNTLSQWNQ